MAVKRGSEAKDPSPGRALRADPPATTPFTESILPPPPRRFNFEGIEPYFPHFIRFFFFFSQPGGDLVMWTPSI